MKSPQERALGYTVVVVIAAIVIFVVIGLCADRLFPYGRPNIRLS
jgi:hypothetical protein